MITRYSKNICEKLRTLPKNLGELGELLDPIINLVELLEICNFLEINSGALTEAYGKLKSPDGSGKDISYIGSWISANEIKGVTVAAILGMIIAGTREVNAHCSDLRKGCVELRDLHTDSQRIRDNGHQDSIQNLIDRAASLENKTDQYLNNSIGFTNDRMQALEINLGTRLEELSRRLDDVAVQQRNIVGRVGELGERGDIHERGLLELNDKLRQSNSGSRQLYSYSDEVLGDLDSKLHSSQRITGGEHEDV